jgi:DNA-binding LytR/AlgR family response regulator
MIRWKKLDALPDRPGKSTIAAPLATLTIFFLAYLLAFSITQGVSANALAAALINVGALAVSGVAVGALLRALDPAKFMPAVQLPFHALAAVAFAFLWYFIVLAGFAATGNWLREGLIARAFSENALVWQIFQGITLYALIALLLSRGDAATNSNDASQERETERKPKGPLLLRDGGEIFTLDHDEIIRLSGAGDYVEVATAVRTFLSTRALASFARSLPPEFIRVHRSHIVRYGAIARAEPAGNGRLTLHLKDGEAITTSRSGARLIRNLST